MSAFADMCAFLACRIAKLQQSCCFMFRNQWPLDCCSVSVRALLRSASNYTYFNAAGSINILTHSN